jgi:predicted transport protein
MSITIQYDQKLGEMLPEISKIRTVLKGAYAVKDAGQILLPSPNQVDNSSAQAATQYNKYLAGAEFDDYTKQTLQSMLGKLNLDNFMPELDSSVDYLVNDADGDGLSLKGLVESLASNALAVKWHVAAVDFRGLQSVALESASLEDAERENPRAVIKQYPRESVVMYNFATINGVKQLSFIMFLEVGVKFNPESFVQTQIKSYLVLALDENGDYYQQKYVYGDKDELQADGERNYVTVNGEPLKFIPIEFASDCEIESDLPEEMGFLSPIADLCLHRYNVSADYKEALRKFVPTTDVFGMNEQDVEAFAKINGRGYRAIGQTNIWPSENIRIETTSTDGSLDSFEKYDESSRQKIRSLGGVIPEYSQGDTSATEAMINATEQNAVLNPLVSGIENAVKNLIAYCAMFEGQVSQEEVSQYAGSINFDMPRDFAKIQPNTEAGRFILEMVNNRVMTREQAVKGLIKLGWHEGDMEDILSDIENIEPDITPV